MWSLPPTRVTAATLVENHAIFEISTKLGGCTQQCSCGWQTDLQVFARKSHCEQAVATYFFGLTSKICVPLIFFSATCVSSRQSKEGLERQESITGSMCVYIYWKHDMSLTWDSRDDTCWWLQQHWVRTTRWCMYCVLLSLSCSSRILVFRMSCAQVKLSTVVPNNHSSLSLSLFRTIAIYA